MIVALQYLRAVAALMVVAFHACDKFSKMPGAEGLFSFTPGLAGVDIFFVISGFIIFVTADRHGTTPGGFIRKRLIRIVPLYWMLTIFLAAIAILKPGLLASTVFDGAHFVASLLFLPWPHPTLDADLPLLVPGWTLDYEMAFYALVAASLLLPKPFRLKTLLALLICAALAGMAIPAGHGALSFYTNSIILEFAAGLLIASAWTKGIAVPPLAGILVSIAGFVLLSMGAGTDLPRIVGAGLPAAMIVAGAVFAERRIGARPLRLLLTLGNASYSIYLSHVIVLPVVTKLWVAAGMHGHGAAFVAVALIVAAAAGVALYELVERPLLGWLGGGRTRKRAALPDDFAARLPAE